MNKKKLSFVLPVYNEEDTLELLFQELMNQLNALMRDYEFEIIFINDGSIDESWHLITQMCKNYKNIKGISFSKNFGYQSALTAGYDYATGDAIFTMDTDMQHPPSLIHEMVEKWQQGFLVVYAQRKARNDSFAKKFSADCYYSMLHMISYITIPRNISDFRLIDSKVLFYIKSMKERSRYLRGMIAWMGFRYSFVSYEQPARFYGLTKYTWSKLFKIAFDGIISFSLFPLKLPLYVGLFIISTSIFMGGYSFLQLFNNAYYPLYTWLIIIIYWFLGMQFMLLWVIGNYISSIYVQQIDRPLYVIDELLNCQNNQIEEKLSYYSTIERDLEF